jgi:hypothetical protein
MKARHALAFYFCACLAVAASGLGGCVQIDGGAVEVSWVVHADGRAITDCSCADPAIASVRIQMVGQGGSIQGLMPCAGRAQCVFGCQRQTGATPFDIPETRGGEQYAISLVAVDAHGADLPEVKAPAPILRSVVRGQPTEVEAFLLEAGCSSECEGMNKTDVCMRP